MPPQQNPPLQTTNPTPFESEWPPANQEHLLEALPLHTLQTLECLTQNQVATWVDVVLSRHLSKRKKRIADPDGEKIVSEERLVPKEPSLRTTPASDIPAHAANLWNMGSLQDKKMSTTSFLVIQAVTLPQKFKVPQIIAYDGKPNPCGYLWMHIDTLLGKGAIEEI